MDRVMRVVPLLSFLCIASITLSLCNGNLNVPCQQNERQTLLMFKKDLDDSSNLLSSWVGEGDCCTWTGVACDNLTGHVRELHLAGYYDEVTREGHRLGGKVNPSLLNLKHLTYLDLSCNDFGGQQFPGFLGSLKGLRYLNLSDAWFKGTVPHQLGNLSSLRYLDLSSNYGSTVENLEWLSGLSQLKHLGMSGVDLTRASHWLQVNKLPSLLVELHLSACKLYHMPSGIQNLTSLKVLYLSSNYFNSTIPLVNTLPSLLVELHLSSCELYHVPSGIQNLTSLKVLDLSWNYLNSTIPQVNTLPSLLVELHLSGCKLYHMPSGIKNLTSLKVLDLSWNYLNSTIPQVNTLPSLLVELHLSGCKLYHMPSGIQNLTSLKVLDLSFNYFNSTIPQWLYSLNHLESLDLYSNAFHGEISSSLGNLTALVDLSLGYNQLEGEIPNSLGNLCKLTSFDLSSNNFRGRVSEIFESLSSCSFGQIDSLRLSDNNFSGNLSDQLRIFKNLRILDLSNNSISGRIPVSLGNLSLLEELVIDHNSFEGVASEVHFTNLTRLSTFSANENSLTLKTSQDWVPPFQLSTLSLSSWRLDPSQLPAWLQSQKHLSSLNMSGTGISGTIPAWLWNISSVENQEMIYQEIYVDLSRNQLSGEVPNIASTHWLDYSTLGVAIYLGSNQFNGSLPLVSSAVTALDLSNSSFSGTLSHFFCDRSDVKSQAHWTTILLLDNNHLTGEIPDCRLHWPNLEVVNLENNNLTGKLPSSIRDLLSLQSLHLRNNNLSGELPVSLQNCRELILLDLRGNKFVGSIPIWFGQSLVVLILRSNMFQGTIPDELCSLTKLQILDLAHNNLSGTIPRCFQKLSSMATKFSSEEALGIEFLISPYWSSYYTENADFVAKGREVKYSTVLRLVTSLDLSRNMLFGEIPEELTNLINLQTLNLSDNLLTGRIPSKIGDMEALESLDLSVNQLSGEISPSISNLTFLNHLNLSYNNLTGQIPKSTQLQSFDLFSYTGNKLCGPPLVERCSTNEAMPPVGDEKHNEGHLLEDGGFYLSLGLGFAFGFWVVLGSLLSNVPWSNAFSQFQNRIVKKFYAAIVKRY
ncbi:receptor-like protein EIX1 [Pyrus x bretschneideri]|uniref:receptor-like protein EIX1 n=1 Tax=Pyrus x bretschneideri TaxID=225117 RepID=UPI0020301A0A|nr:receptor-like protein EIX1 [Pyrus x bretschneideri]